VTPREATPPLPGVSPPRHESEGPVPSAPAFTYRARRMVRGMDEMGFPRYIKRDPRDFFYLLMRAVLPGEPIAAAVSPAQPGEGQWRVTDLADAPFPWPFARARLRPDASQPERWVNLLRVDARRVTPGAAPGPGVLATLRDADAPGGARAGIGWRVENGAARWVPVTSDALFWGPALAADAAVTRGACIDGHGWLVLAVADRAAPGLLPRALDRAGCTAARVALRPSTSLTRDDTRDLLGAAVDPAATPQAALRLRDEPGAVRVFPEVLPVPQRVWWDAQHRRVRYRRDETGAVQVRTVGGSVSMPSWGGSRSATPSPGAPSP
jgi:hypothetical protein